MSVHFVTTSVSGAVALANVSGNPAKLTATGLVPGDVLQGGIFAQQLPGVTAFWSTAPAANPDGTWPDAVVTQAGTLDAYFQSNDFGATFTVSRQMAAAREVVAVRTVVINATVDGVLAPDALTLTV